MRWSSRSCMTCDHSYLCNSFLQRISNLGCSVADCSTYDEERIHQKRLLNWSYETEPDETKAHSEDRHVCMWLRTKAADLLDVRQILSTADEPHAALAAKTLRRNLLTMKRWLLRIARTNTNTEINTLLTTSNYAYLAWKTCFVNFCQ